MSWQIKKLSYSHLPWRLVNEAGDVATTAETIDHPHLGKMKINGPLCGQTKEELIGKILQILEEQQERINLLKQQLSEAKK